MYDPEHDLYELLSMSSDATEAELSDQIAQLRGTISAVDLDEAAEILLNVHTRTRYNAQRATHRMRLLMRASLSVLSGRTPAEGVPVAWSLRSDRPPRPPTPSPVSEDVGANALTVLVVEDDADTRDTIGSVLEEGGYRVTAAQNGRQALGCLTGGPAPDCMVLDLMMPIMDGWSLVAEMRLGGLPAVPILVVTAADSSAYPVPFRQVLRKPINPERLLTLVAELVRSPGPPP
jgi:CheY-like chemotaxis protein